MSDEGNLLYRSFVRKGAITVRKKLSQVSTSTKFIFVASMKSNSDGGLGLMDIYDEHGITEELIYDNTK